MKNLTDTKTLRTDLNDQLTSLLTGLGYTVSTRYSGELEVAKNDMRIGRMDLGSVYVSTRNDAPVAQGAVTFTASIYDARRCEYKVDAAGEMKLDSLIARLRTAAAQCKVRADRAAASAAREVADNVILQEVTGVQDAEYGSVTLGGAKVTVFDGKVDVKLTNLSPADAAKVLAVLGLR